MKIATASTTEADTTAAVHAAITELKERLGGAPDLLLAYYSDPYDSAAISTILREETGADCQIQGGTSCLGAMTERGFHSENGVGLSLWGLHDPEGSYGVGAAVMGDDPGAAAIEALEQALDQAERMGEVPTLVWVNGAPGREEAMISGVESVLGPDVPVAGGSTGDIP